jgi:hypothetical protein
MTGEEAARVRAAGALSVDNARSGTADARACAGTSWASSSFKSRIVTGCESAGESPPAAFAGESVALAFFGGEGGGRSSLSAPAGSLGRLIPRSRGCEPECCCFLEGGFGLPACWGCLTGTSKTWASSEDDCCSGSG